jgi:AraC-like DNA-binding protein
MACMSNDATSLLLALFETVPHVMVCVKDRLGCYTAANDAFVHRTNRRRVADVLGRRAGDLFPGDLAASYEAQDESVFHTGRSVRNQLEIITDRAGRPSWFLTTKLLVVEAAEIVVVSVPAQLSTPGEASGLLAAVEFVHDKIAEPITVRDVAGHVGVSVDAIERAVRRVLGTSPKQFILRTRVEHAATLLSTTSLPLAVVAAASGYYDQSQFTRQFKAITGTTPGQYRSLGLRAP